MLVRIGNVERAFVKFDLVAFRISVDLSEYESYPTELEQRSDREFVRDMSLPRIELKVLASRRIASLDVGVLLSMIGRLRDGPRNAAIRIFAEYRSWRRVDWQVFRRCRWRCLLLRLENKTFVATFVILLKGEARGIAGRAFSGGPGIAELVGAGRSAGRDSREGGMMTAVEAVVAVTGFVSAGSSPESLIENLTC